MTAPERAQAAAEDKVAQFAAAMAGDDYTSAVHVLARLHAGGDDGRRLAASLLGGLVAAGRAAVEQRPQAAAVENPGRVHWCQNGHDYAVRSYVRAGDGTGDRPLSLGCKRCPGRWPVGDEPDHDREARERNAKLAQMLTNWDRCEHGRHLRDRCFSCPGGDSLGNVRQIPGAVIGYDIAGRPYVVPADGARLDDPASWRAEP